MSADADRIAALTAELAEAQENERRINRERAALCTSLDQERAAHERTKADFATCADVGRRLEVRLNQVLIERDAALAEVAAMRLALEWALGHDECLRDQTNGDPSEDGDSPMAAAMRAAIDGTAGRALAARVPLLEAVARRARDLAAETESNAFRPLRDALAALDKKGGG